MNYITPPNVAERELCQQLGPGLKREQSHLNPNFQLPLTTHKSNHPRCSSSTQTPNKSHWSITVHAPGNGGTTQLNLPPLWMRYAPENLPKRLQATLSRDTCSSILSVTLLKIATLWSQAMCLSTEEHTYGLGFSYKQWNCAVSRRVDATGESHMKESKPISER